MRGLSVVHDIPGRLRLRARNGAGATRLQRGRMIRSTSGIIEAWHSSRAGSLLVVYDPSVLSRSALLVLLGEVLSGETSEEAASAEHPAEIETEGGIAGLLASIAIRPMLPPLIMQLLALRRAGPRLRRGVSSLLRGDMGVDVLDAVAIGICILRRDFRSLSTITLLLAAGEYLERWTRNRSEESLANAMASQSMRAMQLLDGPDGSVEKEVDAAALLTGDIVAVRAGTMCPVDGVVLRGEAMVDQSSLTGEALLQEKREGSAMFAGAVVEEGEVVVQATEDAAASVWRRTVHLLQDAEYRKATVHSQAERLAGKLAPASLLLAAVVWGVTRNANRAASVLMVDYSCAIKLATPLAVLGAMRQAAGLGAGVRGGRHLEDLARADVFVFDKTGTLTDASPQVQEVVAFGGWSRAEALRLAACLEEHFPHPVARAIVHQAAHEGLDHREMHSTVEYVASHGVASCMHGQRVLLGSRHFIAEDEEVDISPADEHTGRWSRTGSSIVYLAVGGTLAACIALDDPPRPEARGVMHSLRDAGVSRIIMLTGDLDGMAERIATEIGIEEWMAQALPDEKHRLIQDLKAAGHTVVMVGDGLNDAAALAEASVGICMRQGADIARGVADIILNTGDLRVLPALRSLSVASLERIRGNYGLIVGINTALLVGGLLGRVPPSLGAFLHNAATLAAAANAIRPLPLADSPSTPLRDLI